MTFAAPWKATEEAPSPNNAFIVNPSHPYVVGEPGNDHTGKDLIMPASDSGVVHQWFEGTSEDEGEVGHHSLWRPLKNGEECPGNWIKVETPNPAYGEHFAEGMDYCVKTNDYNPSYFLKNN